MAYHAFMSYSHAADGKLAPALHQALHQFAKPWYRLRALRIFRDKANLPLTPRLWATIQSALDQSNHFILLASPEASASEWVPREIDHWLGTHPVDRLLIVLTAGELTWNRSTGAFDAERTTALPARLMSAFTEEPLYLDLRWARSEDQLSSRHPRFRDAVADLAAALHGGEKDELVGEDVRQHRRARRLAASAIAGLCALTVVAIAVAIFAVAQRNVAQLQRAAAVEQSRISLARQLAAQSTTILTQFPERLPLSVLLATESTRLHASFETNQSLRAALTLLPLTVRSQAEDHPAGMWDRIAAFAFSPDGAYLAVARANGSATLLDLVRGKPVAILKHDEQTRGTIVFGERDAVPFKIPGMDNDVTSIAISPDSRLVATSSKDRSARLWNIPSGREVRKFPHEAVVTSVAFHPGGTYLATGSEDGTIALFDVATGETAWKRIEDRQVRTTTHKRGADGRVVQEVVVSRRAAEIREIAFSPDGRHLAVLSSDGGATLIVVETRRVRHAWFSGGSAGMSLAFSSDGEKLATANGEVASVWDVETAGQLMKVTHGGVSESEQGLDAWIDDVAFSPDGRTLATAGRDATARIWSVPGGEERVRLTHPIGVRTVAFGRDGTTLSTGAIDGARLWDLPFGRERWRLAGANEMVAFSPSGDLVAAGGLDGVVSVLELGRGDQSAQVLHAEPIESVSLSADGGRIATVDRSGELRLWSSAGERIPARLNPVYGSRDLVFSEDGQFVAAAGRNPPLSIVNTAEPFAQTPLATPSEIEEKLLSPLYLVAITRGFNRVRIWETSGGRERPSIDAPLALDLKFDPTGSFLAFRQHDRGKSAGFVEVWDLAGARELGRLPTDGRGEFALSPRGQFVAMNVDEKGSGNSIESYADVWNLSSRTRVARIPQNGRDAYVSFDPSGKRLLTADSDRTEQRELRVWELSTGKRLMALAHQEQITGVRFSPEQKAMATLSGGLVYIWDASTGELLSQLSGTRPVSDFEFSKDGRQLLTGTLEGIAALWLWKTEDLRAEACKRLTRNLSASEWQQYLGATPYQPTCANLPAAPQ